MSGHYSIILQHYRFLPISTDSVFRSSGGRRSRKRQRRPLTRDWLAAARPNSAGVSRPPARVFTSSLQRRELVAFVLFVQEPEGGAIEPKDVLTLVIAVVGALFGSGGLVSLWSQHRLQARLKQLELQGQESAAERAARLTLAAQETEREGKHLDHSLALEIHTDESLRGQVQSLWTRLDKAETDSREAEGELRRRITELERTVDTLREERAAHLGQISLLEGRLAITEQQRDEAIRLAEARAGEILALQDKIRERGSEIQQLAQQRDALVAQQAENTSKIARLETEQRQLARALAEMRGGSEPVAEERC